MAFRSDRTDDGTRNNERKNDGTTQARNLEHFWIRHAGLITASVAAVGRAADESKNEDAQRYAVARAMGRLAAHGIAIRLYRLGQPENPTVVLVGTLKTTDPGPTNHQELRVIWNDDGPQAMWRGHAGNEEPVWEKPCTKPLDRWLGPDTRRRRRRAAPVTVHERLEAIEELVRRLTRPSQLAEILASTPDMKLLTEVAIKLEWASRQINKWAEQGVDARLAELGTGIWALGNARLRLVWNGETDLQTIELSYKGERSRELEESDDRHALTSRTERVEIRILLNAPGTEGKTFQANGWGHAALAAIAEWDTGLGGAGFETALQAVAAHADARTEARATAAMLAAYGEQSWTTLETEKHAGQPAKPETTTP